MTPDDIEAADAGLTPARETPAVGAAAGGEWLDLDLSGLRCPAPIVRLNAAFKALPEGAGVIVRATDPAFDLDVRAWCRRSGNTLVALEAGPGSLLARLRKGGG